jgi:hypothetical protein
MPGLLAEQTPGCAPASALCRLCGVMGTVTPIPTNISASFVFVRSVNIAQERKQGGGRVMRGMRISVVVAILAACGAAGPNRLHLEYESAPYSFLNVGSLPSSGIVL